MFALEIASGLETEMIVTPASDSTLFTNLHKKVLSFNFEGGKRRRSSVLQPSKAGSTSVASLPLSSCSEKLQNKLRQ
jgi:hypothetical protein